MDQNIHIALATDDNYIDYSLVVINSLIRFHPESGSAITVHILTGGLNDASRERFAHFIKRGIEIDILPIDTHAFAERWGARSQAMLFRLELAECLPNVEKIIYLDCDMLVLDDIEKLWNLDLRGKPLGAVGDRAGLQEKRKCYCRNSVMFNSGMMVMDLALWRRENHVVKLRQFWKENIAWMNFADQGLLNAYFGSNYAMLPQNWNIINSVYRNPAVPGMYTDEEVTDAIRNPGIAHFTGHHKPWLFWKRFHHPYGRAFCLCALHTPLSFWKHAKLWLKLKLNGRFVESRQKLPWKKGDIKNITW